MDPTVTNQLNAATAAVVQANMAEQTQAIARQRDTAAAVMNSISAGVFRLIAQSSDPSTYADLQTASHVPTPQPYIVPNFVQPTGKPVGS